MSEAPKHEAPKFSTPEEELAYLRRQVAEKEHLLRYANEREAERDPGLRRGGIERAIREQLGEYGAQAPEDVLAPEHLIGEAELEALLRDLGLAPEEHDRRISELLRIADEKGVRNALSLVEKMGSPHIRDDLHRALAQYVKENVREKGPEWNVLRMTLFEIALPEVTKEEIGARHLKELLSSMEQLYAGILARGDEPPGAGPRHFTFEVALPEKSREVVFYAAVPDARKDLFEKQLLSIFPNAQIREEKNDYNIFVDGGVSVGARGYLGKHGALPLKTYTEFDYDPLNVILNAFSKMQKEGEGAAVQFVFSPASDRYTRHYRRIREELQKGKPLYEALKTPETLPGELMKGIRESFFAKPKKYKDNISAAGVKDEAALRAVEEKLETPVVSANVRLAASAGSSARAEEILSHLFSSFSQFENSAGNRMEFSRLSRMKRARFLRAFSFREFDASAAVPLSLAEATTLIHLPAAGQSSPQFKYAKAGQAHAPAGISEEGTYLGVNRFRNTETKVFISKEDRYRHFYVIGQTGTGKTTLLKNMIAQDIAAGEGVCMIDPHGTDIIDVLSQVPEERFDDVIYFDPSYTERVMALNMLEYDPRYPEQKTFVVNELFSIFQKLYGSVPESMGPIFEQYFRNATMLVLEDPPSGNTLLDVSRVLADARFRELKLSRSKNPVVSQFWREIAAKAGGEQSLANIVPYITSKFDVFTANDYMRPIIAQEHSSLRFRDIMDERKILLVNLAKGRLGEINANLLGLIIVGKILMASLSRVDAEDAAALPPFFLYIDEFQNVTTDSIATILSEARKYKLSLTVAHQFIAQIEERIRDAVFGNVGSMAVFRIGSDDAAFLEKQFEPVFSAGDLLNIDNYNCYAKILAAGRPAKPFNFEIAPPPQGDRGKVEALKKLSYETYGRPRGEVERDIQEKYRIGEP